MVSTLVTLQCLDSHEEDVLSEIPCVSTVLFLCEMFVKAVSQDQELRPTQPKHTKLISIKVSQINTYFKQLLLDPPEALEHWRCLHSPLGLPDHVSQLSQLYMSEFLRKRLSLAKFS